MKTEKCRCGSDHIICEMRGSSIIRVYCDDCGDFIENIITEEELERVCERERLKRAVDTWNEKQRGEKLNGWISVNDKLPEKNSIVLAIDADNPSDWNMETVLYDGERGKFFWVSVGGYRAFTHWMPLPEPPKE